MINTIVLGGGCFWCIEAFFQRVPGVTEVVSGYMGGEKPNPTYREVCGGNTGHVEVVKISFDTETVSLEQILEIFFEMIDPTTLNKQGNDSGTQYRSVIFYKDDTQKETADQVIAQIKSNYNDPIVTTVEKIEEFFPAEEYHQDYYNRNNVAPYCRLVISPKLEKLKKTIKDNIEK